MNEALKKDVSKDYKSAIKLYEKQINNEPLSPIDNYTNLAFLYWSFANDFIFNDINKISDELSLLGGERYGIIVEKGLSNYPNSLELNFWNIYFDYILFGKTFLYEDCLKLIQIYNNDDNLIPYFFLYIFDKITYKAQRNQLLQQCKTLPTAKHIYLLTFLEG